MKLRLQLYYFSLKNQLKYLYWDFKIMYQHQNLNQLITLVSILGFNADPSLAIAHGYTSTIFNWSNGQHVFKL